MNESLSKSLSVVLLLGGITLVAWSGARLAWVTVSLPADPLSELGSMDAESRPKPKALMNTLIDQINEAHLFGKAAHEQPTRTREVPVSKFNLELVAVFATGDQDGLALVADGGGKQSLYGVGNTLPGSVELLEVLADAIVINVNGQRQKLLLRKPGVSEGRVVSDQPLPQGNTTVSLAKIRDRFIGDPSRLTSEVGIRTVVRDGEQLGYRVTPKGRGVDLFEALGLQPGDVVTEINGVRLESHSAALSVLESIADVTSLDLEVERQGNSMRLNRTFR